MIIEIQYAKEQDYLERIIGETSKIIVDNLDQGKPYKDIVKVISISILHFNIGEGDDYIFKGTVSFNGLQKKDAVLKYKVDKFPEYYLIRTKKFDDIVKTPIDEWIYMFKNDEFRENATAKNIDKAKEKLALLKMSKEERKKYELFIKEQTINKSILETAITEGIEIGLKEGEKKGIAIGEKKGVERGKKEAQLNIAKNLLKNNLDIKNISTITGLSLEEIKNIYLN
ncbi:hypothetical protein AN642_02295 [Epulopiscium sp. SCG-B10WGA-EpuloA2]|nr:hypothetical protein AN642_02295 [Epulopiscium sp. SCG-B10WGA-EpuloA2]